MKKSNIYIIAILITLISCKNVSKKENQQTTTENHSTETKKQTPDNHEEEGHHKESEEHHDEGLTFTQKQVDALNIKIGKIAKHNMGNTIQVNGKLSVPPQNEAVVTTTLGANISSIKVIEGDKVSKGQVLAYINHTSIISLQTDYLKTYNQLLFLEKDYQRQKKLYEEQVSSGKDYQRAKAAFLNAKGLEKGYKKQLYLLGLSSKEVRLGNISSLAPLKSPIDGFIEKVKVKLGQYVSPQTPLFEIVNTHHIHLDLMVFEKDVNKVKKSQFVKFRVKSLGNKEFSAKIFAVGKTFEEKPKALHIHAEIENKDKALLPGMYVNAQIITKNSMEQALPEDAVFQEETIFYIFTAQKEGNNIWKFEPKRIIVKATNNGYTSFVFKDAIAKNTLVAQNGAYYLMAEMKKSESKHSH